MSWRFKASKYKNAAPIVPKPENYVRDICVGSYQTYGNNIAASAKFMAFNWDHVGSSVAVLPLDDSGRKSKIMPLLHAHSDTVTDMDFSPFDDGLLATGSQDCSVKLWTIPSEGLQESLSNPEFVFSHKQRRVETVGFHPTADFLLHSSSFTTFTLWDLVSKQEIFSNNNEHSEVIQSVSWKKDGTLVATSCKDKQVRVLDPRGEKICIKTSNSHQSIKDSRVVWLGETNKILTTGFDAQRLRQVIIRDLRNFKEAEKSLELDCSTGILMPLYDADTGMLFLAGKGDTTITYMEVTDKEPFLIEGIRYSGEQTKGACLVPKRALNVMQGEVNRILQLTSSSVIPVTYQVPRKTYRDFHSDLFPDTPGYKTDLVSTEWLKGKNVSVPKISLNPASREKAEEPITPRLGPKPFTPLKLNETDSFDKVFNVPSAPTTKTTNGVHEKTPVREELPLVPIEEKEKSPTSDLETTKNDTNKSDNSWEEENSIDSGYIPKTPSTAERRKIFESANEPDEDLTDMGESNFERASLQRSSIAEKRRIYEKSVSVQENISNEKSPVMMRRKDSFKGKKNTEEFKVPKDDNRKSGTITKQQSCDPQILGTPAPKRTSTVFGRVSKFRHLKGTPAHKSQHFENIRNVSRQIPGECDGFHANTKFIAAPLGGPGGKIAIFSRDKPGKLPDGVIPTLVQGSNIMDFAWDPFDDHRLLVACDDGIVKIWKIPADGLNESTNQPDREFNAHLDKIYFAKFHPTAQDVLATGSYDMTVKIWDLQDCTEKIVLKGHTDQIFSFAWSAYGVFCATVSKDGKIRVYKPRAGDLPIREGKGPVGNRGARIVWALNGNFIVVTGFDKVSERQIYVYNSTNLETPLNTFSLDVSPAILMPFYDEDSSTLFLTGKGDSTIYTFEITEEAPYICPLSHHRCNTLHQGLSFLPKNFCDVSNVEFAVALRLTNNTIEPLSFTVPRIKTDLFQDDLFPPTRVTWKPTMSSTEWFSGKDKKPTRISLQPSGMESLSGTQPQPLSDRGINKSASTPFIGASKPVTKTSWDNNPSSQTKIKETEIQKSVSNIVEVNLKLEQDEMEGVDAAEWND